MSNIYDVEIYKKVWGNGNEGTLIAVLDQVTNVEVSREINKIPRATFDIPRGNVKLTNIDLGKKVQIRKKNGDLEYEGIITGPLDKDQNPVKVTTYGRGFLLGGYRFPFSYEFENIQYDDLINNDLLYERRFFREVTLDDFSEGSFQNTGTINVASGVTPSEEDIWITLLQTPYESSIGEAQLVGSLSDATNMSSVERMVIQGTKIYVADSGLDGLVILSIAAPTTPVYVSKITSVDLMENATYLDVQGNTCVVSGDIFQESLAILDVSDPSDPTIVSSSTKFVYGAVKYDNGYLILQDEPDDFTVVNASLPSLPVVGTLSDPDKFASFGDIALGPGSLAYVGSYHRPDGNFFFSCVSYSSPSDPTILGYISRASLQEPVGLATKGSYVFVAADKQGHFVSVSVASPSNPDITGILTDSDFAGIINIDVSGNTAWAYTNPIVAGSTSRVVIVDVSTPSVPELVGSGIALGYDDFEDIKSEGQLAYVSDPAAVDSILVFTYGTSLSEGTVRFVTQGTYISDAIDLKTDPFDQVTLVNLDRVRYQAVVGQAGDIGVKVRYAPDSGGSPGAWGGWSAVQSQVVEEEMRNLGITTFPAMATTDQWVQAAFEMSSSTEYSNATWYSPVIQAFEIVGKYELQDFSLGSIDPTIEGERITTSFDTHLQVLNHVTDLWGIQWEITNKGTLNAEATIGSNFMITYSDATPDLLTLGTLEDPTWLDQSYGVAATGDYVCTISWDNRFTIIDKSQPATMSILGTLQFTGVSTLNQGVDIDVRGDCAYVVGQNSDSMVVISFGSMATPKEVGLLKTSTLLNAPQAIKVTNGHALIPCAISDNLAVVSISSPSDPTLIGSITNSIKLNYARDVDFVGNVAYVVCRSSKNIVAVSISSPSDPTIIGQYVSAASLPNPHGIAVTDSRACIADNDNDSLVVMSISSPATPVFLGDLRSSATMNFAFDSEATGNYAFVAGYNSDAISMIDITAPVTPVFSTVILNTDLNGVIGLDIQGDQLFACANLSDQVLSFEITSGTVTLTRQDQILLEEEKNCNVVSYSIDDEDLQTTVWGLGHGEGLNRLYSKQENYSNSQDYGKRTGVWETGFSSQSSLLNETTKYRQDNDDPIYNIRLEVPLWQGKHFKAGDVINFKSNPLSVDGSYQVIKEVRREIEAGEVLYLDLGEKIENYSDRYVKEQEELKTGVNDSIKKYESGEVWTEWIGTTDTSWKEIAVNVGWEGEFGKVQVVQVHEETTDSYGTAGSSGTAEIARYTDDGFVIRYRRLNTGANRIRFEISWEVWSTKLRTWRSA